MAERADVDALAVLATIAICALIGVVVLGFALPGTRMK